MNGWRWYGALLRRRRWQLVAIVALGALAPLAGLPSLWLVRHALDTAIPAADIRGLLAAGAGILALRVVGAGITIALARPAGRAVRAITADMRDALMARLHRLRWTDLELVEGARAHSRIIAETERVDQMSHALFHGALPALFPALIYAAVLVALSPVLALVVLLIAPPLRWLAWYAARRLKRTITTFQGVFERFHIMTYRAIHMLPVARAQATEQAALADYGTHTRALAGAGADMAAASVTNLQANSIVATMVAATVLVVGGIAVAQGAMTTGALAAFFVAATQANTAINALAGSAAALFAGQEALRRLEELRAIGSENPAGTRVPDFAAPLTFDAVHLAFAGRAVLSNVSMQVCPGQIAAIVAPNGEGKSTLLKLALGLVQPDAGEVSLGGDAVALLDPALYRGRIGVLPQHPLFFRGSIRDNILFGRPDTGPADLEAAVRRAGLDLVLAALPLGLETPMGDGGQLLSGGERQRVALARALVHRPVLLILDEPSNHLDEEAVRSLVERLLVAPEAPTILMATHDPRLIAVADQVHDLAQGTLTQRVPARLVALS